MDKLYRLSFLDQETFNAFNEANLKSDGKILPDIIALFEVGNVPIAPTYDSDWKELTPASKHTDWAVDIVTKVSLPVLVPFLVADKPKYHNNITGGEFEIIKQ